MKNKTHTFLKVICMKSLSDVTRWFFLTCCVVCAVFLYAGSVASADCCMPYNCSTSLRETHEDESCPNDPSEICSYEIWQKNCLQVGCVPVTCQTTLNPCLFFQNVNQVIGSSTCDSSNQVTTVWVWGVDLGDCDESACFFNCGDGGIPEMELEDENCPNG